MDKKYLFNFVIFFVLLAVALFVYNYFKDTEKADPTDLTFEDTADTDNINNTNNMDTNNISDIEGLQIEILKQGEGEEAKNGDTVNVHYTGTLTDGTKFDSSIDRGAPFPFTLGAGQVIKGWDLGVVGMKVGEKRKLTIAPELGYGTVGAGAVIPPNATLIFEVEMISIQ